MKQLESGVQKRTTRRHRGQEHGLQIFGITKTGLPAIAISVGGLWGCIALETAAMQRATTDLRISVETLEQLRPGPLPVSEPMPLFGFPPVKSS
jgi:hypothetical protein